MAAEHHSKPISVASRIGSSISGHSLQTPSSVSLSYTGGSYVPACHTPSISASVSVIDPDFDMNFETRSMSSLFSDVDKQEDSMALMVRKLGVVKKGYMTERTLRREAEEREKQLHLQLADAQRRGKEKEQLASQLAAKNKELMLRLAEVDSFADPGPAAQDKVDDSLKKKSRKEIETDNKQLASEVKRLSDLLKAVHTGEHEYTTQHLMQARADRDGMERRMQQALEEAQRANEKAAAETQSVMDMNYALLTEQKSLEERLAGVMTKLRAAERTISEKEITLQTQSTEIDHLRETNEEQMMVMKQLAKKMVALKTKVQALELPLKHYHVTIPSRITGHRQAEVQISKNPTTHELMLCVTSNNQFDVYNVNEILSVTVNDATTTTTTTTTNAQASPQRNSASSSRFWVHIEGRHNDPLVFESPIANIIVADIRQYMGVSCEKSRDSLQQQHHHLLEAPSLMGSPLKRNAKRITP